MSERARPVIFCLIFMLSVWATPAFSHPPAELKLTPRQEAEFALFQKKYPDAIRLYRELLEKAEGISQDYRLLVKAYEGAGLLSDAETFLQERIASHPDSSPALYAYGYCLYLMKRDVESEEYLGKALTADPGNALALNNLGALLARKKRFAEAVTQVKNAIAIQPEELHFFQNLKIIYAEMGAPDRFFEDYRASLNASPTSAKTAGYGKTLASELRQKGFKLFSEQKTDEAIAVFEKMLMVYREISHTPGVVAALFSLGLLYEETGNAPLAGKYFREVLEISPDHIQAREKVKAYP